MGPNSIEEYLTKSGDSLDALIELNDKNVSIEVNGPSHFIGRQQNVPTVLKKRQVGAIDDIHLLPVPYWEWDDPKRSNQEAPVPGKMSCDDFKHERRIRSNETYNRDNLE